MAAARDRLASELSTVAAERDTQASELWAIAAERDRLGSELWTVAAERDRLASELWTVAAARDRLASELWTVAAERDRLASELGNVAAERDRLDRDVEALRKEVRDFAPWRSVQFAGKQFRIFGRRGDPYFDSINLEDGKHDFLMWALSRLSKDALIFDIGANVGLTAAMCSTAAKLVYAFEPSPSVHGFLKQTVKMNKLRNVRSVQMAVGSEAGELKFLDDPTSASASHLITDATMGRVSDISVPVTTIDNFVRENDIERLEFMKIDIEGFEIDALQGGTDVIRRFKPSVLVEFNAFTMIGFQEHQSSRFPGLFPGNISSRLSMAGRSTCSHHN